MSPSTKRQEKAFRSSPTCFLRRLVQAHGFPTLPSWPSALPPALGTTRGPTEAGGGLPVPAGLLPSPPPPAASHRPAAGADPLCPPPPQARPGRGALPSPPLPPSHPPSSSLPTFPSPNSPPDLIAMDLFRRLLLICCALFESAMKSNKEVNIL